jgi:hypothetical protein
MLWSQGTFYLGCLFFKQDFIFPAVGGAEHKALGISTPPTWRLGIRSGGPSGRPNLYASQVRAGKKITIYAPMIYTAPCIMFWMRAYPLRGQAGGGWALEFESFLGPVK